MNSEITTFKLTEVSVIPRIFSLENFITTKILESFCCFHFFQFLPNEFSFLLIENGFLKTIYSNSSFLSFNSFQILLPFLPTQINKLEKRKTNKPEQKIQIKSSRITYRCQDTHIHSHTHTENQHKNTKLETVIYMLRHVIYVETKKSNKALCVMRKRTSKNTFEFIVGHFLLGLGPALRSNLYIHWRNLILSLLVTIDWRKLLGNRHGLLSTLPLCGVCGRSRPV